MPNNDVETTLIARVSVPTLDGEETVQINAGRPIIILGSNGSGKSALINRFRNQLRNIPIRYMPGGRPSHLGNDKQSFTAAARADWETNADRQDRLIEARYRPWGGERRNERVLYDMQNSEVQHKLDRFEAAQTASKQHDAEVAAIAAIFADQSPLDQANSLLSQAALGFSLVVFEGELQARTSDTVISIAQLSDGERSAVFIVAEAIAAKTGSVLIIDEPERHLHRAIVVPLLRALISERQDCVFVVSTHELELPDVAQDPQVILVRSCSWSGKNPTAWDLQVLDNVAAIDERVRTDLLGGRKKLLFVEGDGDKLDQPFYALLFPDTSVKPRETCVGVQRAVDGLRSTASMHRALAYGLVDGDGMSAEAMEVLTERGIFPLNVYSVESLYYSDPVIEAVAKRQAQTFGSDPQALIAEARKAALASLTEDQMQQLASIKAARSVREAFISALPKPSDLIGGESTLRVEAPSSYSTELDLIRTCVAEGRLSDIIERYPFRRSGVRSQLAAGLRFQNHSQYEAAALTQLAASDALKVAMKEKLRPLAVALGHET